jgi:two-component system cell cycle sensor histidine kinase/response regulator CckA
MPSPESRTVEPLRVLRPSDRFESRYRFLFENANDAIAVLSLNGTILEANARWREVVGVEPEEMIGRHLSDFAPPTLDEDPSPRLQELVDANGRGHYDATLVRRTDGALVYLEFSNTVVELDDQPRVFAIGHDVTARELANQNLAQAEERYRTLVERIPDVIWRSWVDGGLLFVTRNLENMIGYTPEEVIGFGPGGLNGLVHPDDFAHVSAAFKGVMEREQPFDIEHRFHHKDGHWVWVRNRVTAILNVEGRRQIEGIASNITERRLLEEKARQSQKMEAVGLLTGGIAHDFNNILAVILSNSQFLIDDLAVDDPRRADANEIRLAAERAASLTRQLLAFSRRQVLQPTVVDLNQAVTGLQKMLVRLIGEDVELSFIPAPGLCSIRVDVGQLEQLILNLAVNARDAMPTGGTLRLETANVDVDEATPFSVGTFTVRPGAYVMLAVTDTGCGMSPDVKAHLFEPFFTTKEVGKGTGLGLATCYGIVKQSGGYIWVYSEPGQGTVFKVYFPSDSARPESPRPVRVELRGTELVLVVEDDDRVRAAVGRMLTPRGYNVLVASNAAEAIDLAKRHGEKIQLILSDVVMPGASGPEVVKRVQQYATQARALFMSGYTDHAILRSGSFHKEMNFIQKPFAPEALARKVREVLDA